MFCCLAVELLTLLCGHCLDAPSFRVREAAQAQLLATLPDVSPVRLLWLKPAGSSLEKVRRVQRLAAEFAAQHTAALAKQLQGRWPAIALAHGQVGDGLIYDQGQHYFPGYYFSYQDQPFLREAKCLAIDPSDDDAVRRLASRLLAVELLRRGAAPAEVRRVVLLLASFGRGLGRFHATYTVAAYINGRDLSAAQQQQLYDAVLRQHFNRYHDLPCLDLLPPAPRR